ncbi:ubiquinol-cytochrome C chaperone family protein [Magnetococcales bacterium HHB-1]
MTKALFSQWQKWRDNRAENKQKKALRKAALAQHDQIVEHTLSLTKKQQLGKPDHFPLRFEVMIFLMTIFLEDLKQKPDTDPLWLELIWEITFEGFDHSLRNQGVTDIRIASKMRKIFMDATGRRHAYLSAIKAKDQKTLYEAIQRNILEISENDQNSEDPRINRLIRAAKKYDQCQLLSFCDKNAAGT